MTTGPFSVSTLRCAKSSSFVVIAAEAQSAKSQISASDAVSITCRRHARPHAPCRRANAALVERALGGRITGTIAREATEIEARERRSSSDRCRRRSGSIRGDAGSDFGRRGAARFPQGNLGQRVSLGRRCGCAGLGRRCSRPPRLRASKRAGESDHRLLGLLPHPNPRAILCQA